MDSKTFFVIVFILAILSYYYEDQKVPCKNKKVKLSTKILVFLHHCLVVFGILGFLKYPFTTLLIRIGIVIHWLTNNNYCFATVVRNKECGYHIDKFFHILPVAVNLRYLPFFMGYFFTNRKLEYTYLLFAFFIIKLFYIQKYGKENKMRRSNF